MAQRTLVPLSPAIIGLSSKRISRTGPSNPELAAARIRQKSGQGMPVEFLGLWGGSKEGNHNKADGFDEKSLDFLANVKDEVRNTLHIKSEFTLIFCDAHHVIANGRREQETSSYFWSLEPLVEQRGMALMSLQAVMGRQMELENYRTRDSELEARRLLASPEFFGRASKAVARHSLLVGNALTLREVVEIYVAMEMHSLRQIDLAYGQAPVFFSFSDPGVQKPIALAAKVPMLHFHTTENRHHGVPWYMSQLPTPEGRGLAQS